MELSVRQEKISQALNIVGRVASSKAQLPILNNILIKTENNRLLVAATNLEIATTQYIGAKVIKPGAITVPAKLITEFMSNLPKEAIELKVVSNNLHIKCGKYSSIINGFIADDFPELPTINEKSSIRYEIESDDFKKAVSQTIVTVSSDSSRPILTGVYWHSHEGKLTLASTDGYRLSEEVLVDTVSEVAAVIPSSTLQEVLKTINDETEKIEVLFDETQVRFRVGESEIISRLIDGNFPDYRQLIPEKTDTIIKIQKNEFVRVTKISGLFARESGGSITLTADKTKKVLSIHSVASELGENTSEAEADISNDGQVTLNSRYLLEALSVIDSDEISFGFSGKLSPCIVKSTNKNTDYYHIIMPLKS